MTDDEPGGFPIFIRHDPQPQPKPPRPRPRARSRRRCCVCPATAQRNSAFCSAKCEVWYTRMMRGVRRSSESRRRWSWDRGKGMNRLREEGWSYARIARAHDISLERVRQIVKAEHRARLKPMRLALLDAIRLVGIAMPNICHRDA